MNIEDRIDLIDHMLLHTICNDIVNGTLLTHEDDDTIEMILVNIWEDIDKFATLGVTIGES